MMKILAVETATSMHSVAVIGAEGLLAAETVNRAAGPHLSSMDRPVTWSLMPAIDRLLTHLHLSVDDLDGLAISIGPGSFTGLRVGLATIKGLAMGSGKPIASVSTLHALAMNMAGLGTAICPIMDARRGDVYFSVFDGEPLDERHWEPHAIIPAQRRPASDACELLLDQTSESLILLGDGVLRHRQILRERLGRHAVFAPESAFLHSAVSVARIGKERLARGMLEGEDLAPQYFRQPDATPNVPKPPLRVKPASEPRHAE